ncbi:MAG: murein biosynthesis integral membrane protein MurJ [Methylobacillus sp.]|jgi:putative peptidoglycan lipid II flippase|nr:murein biosynthesis integral membrane protein MurJ [Methylobacillus sp.]
MNLLKALATVGSLTFVSRILGFVRDTLIARVFGAGVFTDAFFVAFRIPNLLRRLFAEGAFSQAFVPVLAEYKNQRGAEETRDLVDHVTTLMGLALVVVTLVGMLAAPWIVYVSAPGFSANPDKFGLTVQLLRITFPYIFFISLVAIAGGVLNTYNRFNVPAFTPVWLNVSFIVATLFLAPYFDPPVMVLGWAVFIGGVLQLLFQLPFLAKVGLLPRVRFNWQDPGVRRILKLMAPAVLGVSVAQLSLIINTIFASFLDTGSVSWLYYADRLMEFPTGMLGVALGTILLPSLSKSYADKSYEEYSRLLDWGLRLTFLLAIPAAVALAVLGVPLIAALFRYGEFNANDLYMTREALVAYSIGLLALILIKVLAPGFYARQNIKTPVKIAVFTLAATQMMNVLFVLLLNFRHAGLALSISLGACINAALLYHHLRRSGVFQPQPGWVAFLLKLVVAVAAMTAALWFGMGAEQAWLDYRFAEKMWRIAALVAGGAITYFLVLWLLGIRPRDFMHRAVG